MLLINCFFIFTKTVYLYELLFLINLIGNKTDPHQNATTHYRSCLLKGYREINNQHNFINVNAFSNTYTRETDEMLFV